MISKQLKNRAWWKEEERRDEILRVGLEEILIEKEGK